MEEITTINSSNNNNDNNSSKFDQLLQQLGSLYVHKMHQEEVYNIYNNNSTTSTSFTSNDSYHKYCTYKLKRLRHTNYKLINDQTTTPSSTTTTTTTSVTVKSLLVHNTKYTNVVTSNISGTTGTNSGSNTTSRKGKGKHSYQSRKVVYENILNVTKDTNDVNDDINMEEKEEQNSNMDDDDDTNKNHLLIEYYNYHPNIIWNLYYQAERAWAVACTLLQQQQQQQNNHHLNPLKQKYDSNNYKKKCSHHRQVQNRLNKAVYWSKMLYKTVYTLMIVNGKQIMSSSNNKTTTTNMNYSFVQECYAYMKWMEGNAALEHMNYILAYTSYSESIKTLYQLTLLRYDDAGSIHTNDNNSIVQQQYAFYCTKWNMYIENILRPLVRYCQYEIKDSTVLENMEDILTIIDTSNINTNTSKNRSSTTSGVTKVQFRNIDIIFDSHLFSQQIIVAYIKLEPQLLLIKDSNNITATDDESMSLQLMSDIDDVMVLVMKEYKSKHSNANNEIGNTSSTTTDESLSQLIAFYSYLKYYKLSIWRQQHEYRINTILLQRQQHEQHNQNNRSFIVEMIHLYTTLQQIVVAMLELVPSSMTLSTNKNNTNDEDDPYMLEAQAHIVRVRAFRCYYMALYYEMMEQQTDSNDKAARVLIQHTQLLTKRAIEEISACDDESTILLSSTLIDKYVDELEQLQNTLIKAMICRYQLSYYMQELCDSSSDPVNQTSRGNTEKKNLWLVPPPSPSSIQSSNRPLWMCYTDSVVDTDSIDDSTIIQFVDVPPKPIPIPCKGVFYDIASQQIDEVIYKDVLQVLHNDYLTKQLDERRGSISSSSVSSSNYNFMQWFTGSNK